jgi:tyrosyl-tRNA synthetase
MLSPEQIAANEAEYLRQFSTFLDLDRVELRHNSEWLAELGTAGLLELAARATVARLLERDDFGSASPQARRSRCRSCSIRCCRPGTRSPSAPTWRSGARTSASTCCSGATCRSRKARNRQVVMTHELLVGTDGVRKMSQSLGNYVGLLDPADEVYGKTMSVPDGAMPQWLRLASGLPPARCAGCSRRSRTAPCARSRRSGRWRSRSPPGSTASAADAGAQRFDQVHRARAVPDDVAEAVLPPGDPVHLPALLVDVLDVGSTSEARRLIAAGAVRVDGEPVTASTCAAGTSSDGCSSEADGRSSGCGTMSGVTVDKPVRSCIILVVRR